MLSFLTLIFFSGGELPVDKRCEFSSFLWVWSILGPESTDVIFCFHFLSSPFILHSFPLCSFHVAFMSFHFAFILLSCPFMFRRYVSKIQVFESLYAQAGQVGISPNARVFFHILLSLLSFSYRFGGLCRLPSSGVMNMCIYIYIMNMCIYKLVIVLFYSYCFLGRQCVGSVKVQAKLKWNARGYYILYHLFSQPSIHQPKSPIHHIFVPLCHGFFLWLFGLFGSPCSPRRRPSWHRRPTSRAPAASPRRPGAAAGAGAPSGRAAPPPGCDGRAPGAACRRTWGTTSGGLPGDSPWELENSLGIMENVGNGKIEGIWSILLPNVWFYCICFHFKPSLMSLMLENGRKIIWLKGKKLEIYNQERAAKPGNSSLGSTIESLFAPTVLEHTWTTCYICTDWPPYRTDFKDSADLSRPHWTHGRKIQWLHLKMCPFEQGHNWP